MEDPVPPPASGDPTRTRTRQKLEIALKNYLDPLPYWTYTLDPDTGVAQATLVLGGSEDDEKIERKVGVVERGYTVDYKTYYDYLDLLLDDDPELKKRLTQIRTREAEVKRLYLAQHGPWVVHEGSYMIAHDSADCTRFVGVGEDGGVVCISAVCVGEVYRFNMLLGAPLRDVFEVLRAVLEIEKDQPQLGRKALELIRIANIDTPTSHEQRLTIDDATSQQTLESLGFHDGLRDLDLRTDKSSLNRNLVEFTLDTTSSADHSPSLFSRLLGKNPIAHTPASYCRGNESLKQECRVGIKFWVEAEGYVRVEVDIKPGVLCHVSALRFNLGVVEGKEKIVFAEVGGQLKSFGVNTTKASWSVEEESGVQNLLFRLSKAGPMKLSFHLEATLKGKNWARGGSLHIGSKKQPIMVAINTDAKFAAKNAEADVLAAQKWRDTMKKDLAG